MSDERPLNPIQWNALAIVFLIGFMPFAIAFITNAGSSSNGDYQDSLPPIGSGGTIGNQAAGSYWINNGGDNHTAEYVLNDATIAGTYYENCAYVVDGYCVGFNANALNRMPLQEFNNIPTNDWSLPMLSTSFSGSHYYGDPSGAYYFGSSGDGPFTMLFNPNYIKQIENEYGLDKLRFTFVNTDVNYACDNAIFENITFDYDISFFYDNKTKKFDGFTFEGTNQYAYRGYERHSSSSGWNDFCHIGFQIVFDFTGFESLSLVEWNNGEWNETWFQLNFDNFKNTDRVGSFADTAVPFACNCVVKLGVEHQYVNTVMAGFIIRSGTLGLSLIVVLVGVASTRQWNPFKSFIGGILP